jgi:hypothetical protein
MNLTVISKFWREIEQLLIAVEQHLGVYNRVYFASGTLIIDKVNKIIDNNIIGTGVLGTGIIGLNLNGKGFITHTPELQYFNNNRIYQPQHITILVRKIYLDVKGETEFYKKETE